MTAAPQRQVAVSQRRVTAPPLFLPAFLTATLAFAVFIPSLSGEFLKDDGGTIVANPTLGRPSAWLSFLYDPAALTVHPALGTHIFRPLTGLSWGLSAVAGGFDLAFPGGRNPYWFHLADLLLHALNAGLVFLLARGLLDETLPAAGAALLFALHPAQVESVAYASGAWPNGLALLFCLLTFRLHARVQASPAGPSPGDSSSRSGQPGAYALFALALLSKETALFLPLALAADDIRTAPGEGWGSRARRWAPYAALCAAFFTWRATVLGQAAQRGPWGDSWLLHAQLAAHGLFQDVANALWPSALRACYAFVEGPGFAAASASKALFLLGLAAAAALGLRRGAVAGLALSWSLAALLPVSNLLPIAALAADRFLHAPLVGLGLLWGCALQRLPTAWGGLAAGALALTLGLAAAQRQIEWQTEFTLDAASYGAAPEDPCTALSLAATYFNWGMLRRSEELARSALGPSRLRPNALEGLARIRLRQGRRAEAASFIEQALALEPGRGSLLELRTLCNPGRRG